MIGMDFSLRKNKETWDAFREGVTFELRYERALEMQKGKKGYFLEVTALIKANIFSYSDSTHNNDSNISLLDPVADILKELYAYEPISSS